MREEGARLLRRGWTLSTGFPGLHAINMVLAIGYTLVQTLVFARVLDARMFSLTIAATAVGLYLQPLNQAVARANFVLLRERTVRQSDAGGMPEASAAFYANQVILGILSVAAPALLGVTDVADYVSLACYVFMCTFTNIWVIEVQMTMLATDRALIFEHVNLLRRILICLTVGWLWVQRDFLVFNVAVAVQTLVFHIYGLRRIGGNSGLFSWPRGLTRAAALTHLHRLWVSMQATFAEWLVLNAPYAIFTLRFGIGPGLVAIDVVLKLVRVIVSVTRNLSEIALPRVSHAVLSGTGSQARLLVLMVLGAAGAGAAVLAAIVTIDQRLVFSVLLGPNNTVPDGAGWPTAVAVLSAVAFAASGNMIGHTGDLRTIQRFFITPIVVTLLFLGIVKFLPVTVLEALWVFAGSMAATSAASIVMLNGLLRRPPAKAVGEAFEATPTELAQ